ncbi:MAG: phospholipase D-like domain-containing protein [Planctomycetaceae bacterium]|jgi:superfamily II DNA or RNA helicase|nr:phospholipase D-like domain-containing protein [Planctomycetaceae bacterium]
MPTIYDNIENALTDGLGKTLELSKRADCCIGYFNLRGWNEIAEKIDQLSGDEITERNENVHRICRLLIGMSVKPTDILRKYYYRQNDETIDNAESNRLKKQLAQEFRDQLTIGIPTNHDEKTLRQLSQQMKDKKVCVKLHLRYPLHAKLYLAHSDDSRVPIVGFLGSSNLTIAGLAKQGELNIDVLEQDAARKLATWFDEHWCDSKSIDITEDLIEIIDHSWAGDRLIPPYHIFVKIAYHLSYEARMGIADFTIPAIFKKKLLDFQQTAVSVAARHLHKHGGVVIGDVVGLGKTIVGTALAKLFEEDFSHETLIICPKNLTAMWESYVYQYQLHAKVTPQSRVQSELKNERRYRTVIVDESHNLRNSNGSRYKAIKDYLDLNESKVILLSATPYNKSHIDLANQLRLFIPEDKDLGISPEKYIKKIGGQVQFNAQHTEISPRSLRAFELSNEPDDWQNLMQLYLVRRTRNFIKKYYAKTDPKNGQKYLSFSDGTPSYFPERVAKKVEYPFDPKNPDDQYAALYADHVVDLIHRLDLPRYGLQLYRNNKPAIKPTPAEDFLLQNLNRAGKRLMGFCRTMLFKRLESSGYSFLLSLARHVLRNYIFVHAIKNNLPLPIGKNIAQNLDDFLEDDDTDNDDNNNNNNNNETNSLNIITQEKQYIEKAEELYQLFSSDKYEHHFDWVRNEFFNETLLESLEKDNKNILQILTAVKTWNPANDRQLNALYDLLTQKHGNDKVLVFTQFADTAFYLTEQLKRRGVINIESVTGKDDNPTQKAFRFSPQSNIQNNRSYDFSGEECQELRVLISTDVLSEGQNLQDAHVIVNYDLPWAIIRLIQRAGRVDRIGQRAKEIYCYSFLPEDGIEKIIDLRGRLKRRIKENADLLGSDETFFDGDPINIADLYNEKSGLLNADDEDTEVDLGSQALKIWEEAIKAQPELNKIIPELPNVIYSAKQNIESNSQDGVIVYVKTINEDNILTWIDREENIVTQSPVEILKAIACEPDTKPLEKLENHHELLGKALDVIRADDNNRGSSLGKRTGTKYKVYSRLERYCNENKDKPLLVTETLKKAVDDIYRYRLRESAKESLFRQIKVEISDESLADLVISLYNANDLVIKDEEEQNTEPQVICSMGIVNVSNQ